MLFSPTIGAAITAGYRVPAGALPCLPHHRRRRPSDARLAPRRGRDDPYPEAVVPILPAECAVYRSVPLPSSIGSNDEGKIVVHD
jgi:hypothetical protein